MICCNMSLHTRYLWGSIWFLSGVWIWNICDSFFFSVLVLSSTFVWGILFLLMMKQYHVLVLIAWFFLCLWTVFSTLSWSYLHENESSLAPFFQKERSIQAQVESVVKISSTSTTYRIHLRSVNQTPLDTDGYLILSSYKKLTKGNELTLRGKLKPIKDFSPLFSYRLYLLSQWIYFQIDSPEIKSVWEGKIPWYTNTIEWIKQNLLSHIFGLYPPDEAVLLAGILIGSKENISEDMQNNFQKSWLTHLITVSGFNITVIVIFAWFLFQKLPVVLRLVFVPASILIYATLVGGSAPVVRASIMGIIGYLILLSGRKWESLALTLSTLAIMVIINPLSLNYDISLHLSFLALLWLVYFQGFWKKVFSFVPNVLALRESLVLTLSAMTTTLPIMLFQFGQVSVFAPFANMLVGGVIPLAMGLWAFSIVLDCIHPSLGFISGFLGYYSLAWVNWVASFFANVPHALLVLDLWGYGVYLETLTFGLLVTLAFWLNDTEEEEQEEETNQEMMK